MHNHNRWCWFKRVLPFPFPFAGAEPNIWQRQIKGCFACAARKSLSNLSASSQEHCFCSFWREHFLPFFPASCVEELLTDAEHKLSFPSEGSFADLLLTAGYHCSANSLVSHVCSGASRVQERSRCKEEGRARHFFFLNKWDYYTADSAKTLDGLCSVGFGCAPDLIYPHPAQITPCQLQLLPALYPHTYTPTRPHLWWHTKTHPTQTENTQFFSSTHVESRVSVTKEREGDRDFPEPGASIVLGGGLGVPLVRTEGVEVLQGHGGFHPGQQGAEAGQEGLQHQQQHGLGRPGMELTAGTVEGREELTHLRQQVQSGAEQDKTGRFFLLWAAAKPESSLTAAPSSDLPLPPSHSSFQQQAGLLARDGGIQQIPCILLAAGRRVSLQSVSLKLNRERNERRGVRGESSVIQLRCFSFFFPFLKTIQWFGPWRSA